MSVPSTQHWASDTPMLSVVVDGILMTTCRRQSENMGGGNCCETGAVKTYVRVTFLRPSEESALGSGTPPFIRSLQGSWGCFVGGKVYEVIASSAVKLFCR